MSLGEVEKEKKEPPFDADMWGCLMGFRFITQSEWSKLFIFICVVFVKVS